MTDSGATPSTCSPRALDRNRARASRHQAARPTNGARRRPLVRGGLLVARRALHRRRCVLSPSQPAHLVSVLTRAALPLAGAIDGRIHIWDFAPPPAETAADRPPPSNTCTLHPVASLDGHATGPARAVAFNPKAAMLASAGRELVRRSDPFFLSLSRSLARSAYFVGLSLTVSFSLYLLDAGVVAPRLQGGGLGQGRCGRGAGAVACRPSRTSAIDRSALDSTRPARALSSSSKREARMRRV